MRVHSRFTMCWLALAGFILLGGAWPAAAKVGRFRTRRGSGRGSRARPQCALGAQLPEGGVEHRRLSQCRKTLGHTCPGPGERSGRLCPGLRSPLRPAPRPLSQRRAAHGAAVVKQGRRDQDRHPGGLPGLPRRLDRGEELRGAAATPRSITSLLFSDLFRADGRRRPLVPFTINTARGTTNAGMMAVVLLSVRNPDLSRRTFPAPTRRQPPRARCPRLVEPQAQEDDVLRRPDPGRLGPGEHAVPARREDPRRVQGARADVPGHPGLSPEPRAPEVPLPDRRGEGPARQGGLREDLRPLPRHLRREPVLSQQDRAARRDRDRPGAVAGHLGPGRRALQLHLVRRAIPRDHPGVSATRPRPWTASGPRPLTSTTARYPRSTRCSIRRRDPIGSPGLLRRTSSITTARTSAGSSGG